MLPRLSHQRTPDVVDRRDQSRPGRARIQPQIGRDLVVAAARCVQPAARVADLLDQPRLDVHVHVLERRVPRQLPSREPPGHAPEPARDRRGVLGADQPLRREHLRVRDRACNIVRQQPPIELDRGIQRRGRRIEGLLESSASRTFRSGHGAQYKRHMTNTQRVTFPSSAGEASGVLATPTGDGKPPGVVILQEWWGINEQIQTVAQRYADAGFVALVPDLYHGQVAKDADEAGRMMKALDFGKAIQEIAGAVAFLRERSNGKIAVTGYCLGGALAFASAVNIRGLAAVAPYYGLPGELDWTKID